jgi:predicted DNA-binding transcriptional regulator AlpA
MRPAASSLLMAALLGGALFAPFGCAKPAPTESPDAKAETRAQVRRIVAQIEAKPELLLEVRDRRPEVYKLLQEQRPDLFEAMRRKMSAPAPEAPAAPSDGGGAIAFSDSDLRELQARAAEARREELRLEKAQYGRELTPDEREIVERYGELLTLEQIAERQAAEAEELAKAEAAEAATAKKAADAASKAAQDAAAAEQAALDAKIDSLRGLSGDQYNIRRYQLINEGVIDPGVDYRRADDEGRQNVESED